MSSLFNIKPFRQQCGIVDVVLNYKIVYDNDFVAEESHREYVFSAN